MRESIPLISYHSIRMIIKSFFAYFKIRYSEVEFSEYPNICEQNNSLECKSK